MAKIVTATSSRAARTTAERIFSLISREMAAVEEEFERQARSNIQIIAHIGRYLHQTGGKRVRPALLLLTAKIFGEEVDASVIRMATVMEFLHTATLVHDDIIDESDTRRGRPAVHARWGNDVTVLLGDYLYIKSMALALTHDTLEIVRVLCDATLKMIEGEIYQLTKNGDAAITEEEHFDIIRRKTAFLFGASAQIGGMLGRVDKEQEAALQQYGFNLGIAFQVVDDLLDFTGELEALGKPVGADLVEGKMTLPLIHLLQQPGHRGGEIVREIIEKRTASREQWQEILDLLREHRSIEYASRRAVDFAERAKKQLAVFPSSSERDALMALPDYVLSRDR